MSHFSPSIPYLRANTKCHILTINTVHEMSHFSPSIPYFRANTKCHILTINTVHEMSHFSPSILFMKCHILTINTVHEMSHSHHQYRTLGLTRNVTFSPSILFMKCHILTINILFTFSPIAILVPSFRVNRKCRIASGRTLGDQEVT